MKSEPVRNQPSFNRCNVKNLVSHYYLQSTSNVYRASLLHPKIMPSFNNSMLRYMLHLDQTTTCSLYIAATAQPIHSLDQQLVKQEMRITITIGRKDKEKSQDMHISTAS